MNCIALMDSPPRVARPVVHIGGVLLAALLWTQPALAFAPDFGKPRKKTFLNLGVEGLAIAPRGENDWTGGVALRTSLVTLGIDFIPTVWIGGYARGQYDDADAAWRGAAGVGGGFNIFGAELGTVAHRDDRGWSPGLEATALLTVGYAGIFARHTRVVDRAPITELGLRLNLPTIVDRESRNRRAKLKLHAERNRRDRDRLAGLELKTWRVVEAPSRPHPDFPCNTRRPQWPRSDDAPETRVLARVDGVALDCALYDRVSALDASPTPGSLRTRRNRFIMRHLLAREVARAGVVVPAEVAAGDLAAMRAPQAPLSMEMKRTLKGHTEEEARARNALWIGVEALLVERGLMPARQSPRSHRLTEPEMKRRRGVYTRGMKLAGRLMKATKIETGPALVEATPGVIELDVVSREAGAVHVDLVAWPKRCGGSTARPRRHRYLARGTQRVEAEQRTTIRLELPSPQVAYETRHAKCPALWNTPFDGRADDWEVNLKLSLDTPKLNLRWGAGRPIGCTPKRMAKAVSSGQPATHARGACMGALANPE